LAHLLAGYYTQVVAFSDPGSMVQELPLLILLVFVNIYILFKVPAMTQSLFGGHTGGHDGGMGVAMMAIRAALKTATRETRSEMSVATKATPEITRAAERYLEQYGDPLVMNTYLKVTILVLAVVSLALAVLVFRSQKALADMHPMIVRINDVGQAEAIDYRNFQYRPQEAENKYYLSRWAELYFSRNRFTIERDQTNSLYFLNGDVQRAVIEQERKDNIIQTYIKESTLPYVDVEVKNIVLDDLRQSPYSARIEFEKVYTNPADHTELKRERWTASVTYVFRETVKNKELPVNPLGLAIVRFRVDQAFS
jgi:type IV secretion system protein VirB5